LLLGVAHFEAALARAPGYLPTRVAYARCYAAGHDTALYWRLVEEMAGELETVEFKLPPSLEPA
jgi:hypothetical protein